MVGDCDVSIIIVNWNSVAFLRRCLASVQSTAGELSIQIVVVDNGSFDGCAEMLRQEFPCALFIQSGINLGFARANNLGYEHSTGRTLLFLNPDTELVGAALGALLSSAIGRPDVGIAGPKLLNSDLTIQIESIRAFPSLLNQFLDTHYLKSRFPRLSLWGMRPLFEDDQCSPSEVEVVSGACLMIKRDVFEGVGGFSTQYFMYSEDVDLCYKARVAGWKRLFVPQAEVIHHGGQSSAVAGVNHFATVMIRESRFQFLRKSHGNAYALGFRVLTAVVAMCRLSMLLLSLPVVAAFRRRASVSALMKWATVLLWSIGRRPVMKSSCLR